MQSEGQIGLQHGPPLQLRAQIEDMFIPQRGYAVPHAVAALYTPSSVLEPVMRTIITHWSIITGRDMKAGKVAPLEIARRSA